MIRSLKNFRQNFQLVITFSIYDLKKRYLGTVFGLGWYLIWSLLNIFLYTVIFAKLMQIKLPNLGSSEGYGLYLALGLFPWNFFSNLSLRSSAIFIEFKHFLNKTNISVFTFLGSIYISEFFAFFIAYVPLIVIIYFIFKPSLVTVIISLLNSIFLGLFGLCLGFIIAMLGIFFKDFLEFFKVLIHFLFWLTPIVYVQNIVPKVLKNFLIFNPLTSFIEIYHSLLFHYMNIKIYVFYGWLFAILLCLLGKYLWKKWEGDIRDLI